MICTVGLICVDIVNFMSKYPPEDSDQRCGSQTWERGGNAANSATVLALMSEQVECIGTLAKDKLLGFLLEDMDSVGIRHDNCPIIDDCGSGPISIVLCSRATGSRTIVHSKGNLPELSFEHFKKLNLEKYSWMHFEGRNANVLPKMIQSVYQYNREKGSHTNGEQSSRDFAKYRDSVLPISLELEKELPKETLDEMLPLVGVLIIGKDFAKVHLGAQTGVEAARKMLEKWSGKLEPGTLLICPWGEDGASYCVVSPNNADLEIKTQKAYEPREIVDSLGAGDTFNGTIIYCLKNKMSLEDSVKYACRVASKKLEMKGMKGLKSELPHLLPLKTAKD